MLKHVMFLENRQGRYSSTQRSATKERFIDCNANKYRTTGSTDTPSLDPAPFDTTPRVSAQILPARVWGTRDAQGRGLWLLGREGLQVEHAIFRDLFFNEI